MTKGKRHASPSTRSEARTSLALSAGPMADADYRAALEKARKGDMEAMQIVRRAFDEKPERWRALGEIAWLARHCVVGAAAGKDLARVEAYMRRIAAQEAKIIGPDAPILERILAARIAVAWFEVCHLDAVVGQNANANARALEALDARRDRAHRRLRQSIRELAVLRRLTRPGAAVHVNAAMAQVNVRGTRGA